MAGNRKAYARSVSQGSKAVSPILVVFGTRPEAIKLAPVVRRLKESALFEPIVCFTGQHGSEMIDGILDLFSIHTDLRLATLQHGQTLAQLTHRIITQISPVYERIAPRVVLVQGDTTSGFVGALTAFYHKIPVAHVEAGLRTHDLSAPYPEEANRQMISRLSDFHFAPTARAAKSLYQENILPDRVIVTGNTVIDALFLAVSQNSEDGISTLSDLMPTREACRRYLLVTLHRREIFGNTIRNMLGALADVAHGHPELDIVLLSHPNPEVQSAIEDTAAVGMSNFWVISPQPYRNFVDLMAHAHLILTDSGGVQEEAPSLDRPVLVLRDRTEREEGIEAGCLLLVGTDRHKIVDTCEMLLRDEGAYKRIALSPNPYGDGRAAIRICHALSVRYS